MRLAGKPVVSALQADVRERVCALRQAGISPALAIVRVGERPDDLSYERSVLKAAEVLGVDVRRFVLDANASHDELEQVINCVNEDDSLHGCLMFRPLPRSMDETALCNQIAPEKDVDGVSAAALASVFTGQGAGFPPSTAQACISVLDHYGIPLAGARVAVVGRSLVVGRPVAMMLLARDATVTVCHSRSIGLQEILQEADIVICATGRAHAFGSEFFRKGQTVLDVGINFSDSGQLCGDVDFDHVEPLVRAITPVPGGIGAVTSTITMLHTVRAAEVACGCVERC